LALHQELQPCSEFAVPSKILVKNNTRHEVFYEYMLKHYAITVSAVRKIKYEASGRDANKALTYFIRIKNKNKLASRLLSFHIALTVMVHEIFWWKLAAIRQDSYSICVVIAYTSIQKFSTRVRTIVETSWSSVQYLTTLNN